jgi:ribosomal-protein-alanine N-acetyltransferase
MSQALETFAREVALAGVAFTVRDAGGVPAPVAPGGRRTVPFWSNRERVERLLRIDGEFAGFAASELPWATVRDKWLVRCEREGWLVGINWAGDRALGFDAEPPLVRGAVEAALARASGFPSDTGRVVIETHRLLLREWVDADAALTAAVYDDPALTKFVGDGTPRGPAERAAEIARCRRSYRERGFGLWAVIEKTGGNIIGHCGLQDLDGGEEVALGYALGTSWRGRGLAVEAARAAIEYGFSVLRLERIVAVTQPVNAESLKVMGKLGMKFVEDSFHYGKKVVVYEIKRTLA